jgi:hypothetical protein
MLWHVTSQRTDRRSHTFKIQCFAIVALHGQFFKTHLWTAQAQLSLAQQKVYVESDTTQSASAKAWWAMGFIFSSFVGELTNRMVCS